MNHAYLHITQILIKKLKSNLVYENKIIKIKIVEKCRRVNYFSISFTIKNTQIKLYFSSTENNLNVLCCDVLL